MCGWRYKDPKVEELFQKYFMHNCLDTLCFAEYYLRVLSLSLTPCWSLLNVVNRRPLVQTVFTTEQCFTDHKTNRRALNFNSFPLLTFLLHILIREAGLRTRWVFWVTSCLIIARSSIANSFCRLLSFLFFCSRNEIIHISFMVHPPWVVNWAESYVA